MPRRRLVIDGEPLKEGSKCVYVTLGGRAVGACVLEVVDRERVRYQFYGKRGWKGPEYGRVLSRRVHGPDLYGNADEALRCNVQWEGSFGVLEVPARWLEPAE